jgi:hypothetical protein
MFAGVLPERVTLSNFAQTGRACFSFGASHLTLCLISQVGLPKPYGGRTDKSANPDLRYSGLGRFCFGPNELGATIQLCQGESRLREESELSRTRQLPLALVKLDSVRNLHDFRPLFEVEAREKSFFNFPQIG